MTYKLLYCAIINDQKHQNMIKVGDTDFTPSRRLTDYAPDDPELIKAANARIRGWSGTAAAGAQRIWCDILIRYNDRTGNYEDFRDGEIHKILQRAGFPRIDFDSELDSGREWFAVDLDTVKAATKAAKEGRDYLDASEMPAKDIYELREEQQKAVNETHKRFKTADDMLWHAKMRFGKTITALNLVKKEGYKRTIIITHRPVVEDSWGSDFYHVFGKEDKYVFLTKISDATSNYSDDYTDEAIDRANDDRLFKLYCDDTPIVYFASIQDLRGSKLVGGKFEKNKTVFDIDWDLVIIDEAHEGTKTDLGQNVIMQLIKKNTKRLDLSGTAYNLLDKYSDDKSVFTWDYVMEQQYKEKWPKEHPGEPNPYADMPVMHINTFDLQKALEEQHLDISEKAFTFHEFFRTWTGDLSRDGRSIPAGFEKGDFVHRDAVKHFLDLLSTNEESSRFPFVDIEGCKQNTHTLWMVPGVKEAAALSKLLQKHPFFGLKDANGKPIWGIANVAGEGDHDEETHFQNALNYVRKTIEKHDRTITLSCGRLTTGVTVKEWSSVFMLSGSDNTDAKQYMQTIFRVQSAGKINGVQKTDCYVYDFAPDRALVVVAEVAGSRRSKRGGVIIDDDEQKKAFEEFLNFCPIVAIDGAEFKPFSVENLVSQVNRVHIDRALKTGFMDNCIYDMAKFKTLTGDDVDALNKIFGKMKATSKKTPLSKAGTAKSGAGEKQTGKTETGKSGEKPKPGSDEDKAQRKMIQELLDRLRTVSIRIPLLFYGGDFEIEEGRLAEVITGISEASWNVFMPENLSKDDFRELVQYYNQETVVGAAKIIRAKAAEADRLPPTERTIAIANIFGSFHNPSHETVLTPWRVVNMHMAETLGGYRFYNEKFEENDDEYYRRLQEPEFEDQGEITRDTLGNPDAKILEINSKSGLYPLYCAYSIYRAKLKERGKTEAECTPEQLLSIWDEACSQIYVLCQSEMSVSITRRTLYGNRNNRKKKNNIQTDDKLLDNLKKDVFKYANGLLKASFWNEGDDTMVFDAVVGNPPYQGENHSQIYPFFYKLAISSGRIVSMIFPIGWQQPKNANNLKMMNDPIIKEDKQLVSINNMQNVFPGISGAEWVNILLWRKDYDNCLDGNQLLFTNSSNPQVIHLEWDSDKVQKPAEIVELSKMVAQRSDFVPLQSQTSMSKPYGIRKDVFTKYAKYGLPEMQIERKEKTDILIYGSNETIRYVPVDYPLPRKTRGFEKYKVLVGSAWGNMTESTGLGGAFANVIIASPHEACTETFQESGTFDCYSIAEKHAKYLLTKFARACLYVNKISQMSTQSWGAVPVQDYHESWWSKSIREIDEELFEKYELPQSIRTFIRESFQAKTVSNIVNYKPE